MGLILRSEKGTKLTIAEMDSNLIFLRDSVTGSQGTQGPVGSIGVQGSQGPQGLGMTGSIGVQGPQGSVGSIGVQGPQGLQGMTGNQKLMYRIYVGPNGDYSTVKSAVNWFNSNAVGNTEILIDGGNHLITDTIEINNTTYQLQIRGLGSGVTTLEAATGLSGKPMFNIKTACDINKICALATTLSNYGNSTNENFINFDTTNAIYTEITDFISTGFNIAINDTIGTDIFLYNFIIDSPVVAGIRINTSNTNSSLDVEVGTISNAPVGIDLLQASNGNFVIFNNVFENPLNGVGIRYGNLYTYTDGPSITGNKYNNVGQFITGFDFKRLDARDNNIHILNNPGFENKNPHFKLNITDNTITTTITTGGVFQKLNGINSKTNIIFNVAATSGTWSFTYDGQTTSAIAFNASAATIKTAIDALSNITAVTVTQIVANKEWNIEFITANEGFSSNQSVTNIDLGTTTTVTVDKSFYTCKTIIENNRFIYKTVNPADAMVWITGNVSCNQNNRDINIGIKKNNTGSIISPFTARTSTTNIAYPFAICAYLEDLKLNDYFEIWCNSTTTNDIVRLWDLQIMSKTI